MNVSAVFVHATTLDPIDFHSLYFYSHIFMQILGYGIKKKKKFNACKTMQDAHKKRTVCTQLRQMFYPKNMLQ